MELLIRINNQLLGVSRMKFLITFILLFSLPLIGCKKEDNDDSNVKVALKKVEELLDEIDEEDLSQDYNFDGIPDVYFEYYEHSYIQLIDRNFDGKPDERYEYDLVTDFILDGRLDNNFDGIFETQIVMSQGVVQFEFVDSDNDSMIDIVSSFKDGVLKELQKYAQNSKTKSNSLEIYFFEFGAPVLKEINVTKTSKIEFHEKQVSKIRTQDMQATQNDN